MISSSRAEQLYNELFQQCLILYGDLWQRRFTGLSADTLRKLHDSWKKIIFQFDDEVVVSTINQLEAGYYEAFKSKPPLPLEFLDICRYEQRRLNSGKDTVYTQDNTAPHPAVAANVEFMRRNNPNLMRDLRAIKTARGKMRLCFDALGTTLPPAAEIFLKNLGKPEQKRQLNYIND